jgi:hypothetical protein
MSTFEYTCSMYVQDNVKIIRLNDYHTINHIIQINLIKFYLLHK